MLSATAISLLISGVTLSLVLVLLPLALWHSTRVLPTLLFATFVMAVLLWLSGALLGRGTAAAQVDSRLTLVGVRLLLGGFAAAALLLPGYILSLHPGPGQSLLWGLPGLAALCLLPPFLIQPPYAITQSADLSYNFPALASLVLVALNLLSLLLIWRSFRQIRQPSIIFGGMLFCLGQLAALLSEQFRTLAIAENIAGLSVLIMTGALFHTQLLQPLAGQSQQIGIVRDVGLVISSRLRLQNALRTIAEQAAVLVSAHASIIFLADHAAGSFVLAAQYNIDEDLLNQRLPIREGVAGQVARERRAALVNDYQRNWKGTPDTAFARTGFGAVIAVPLFFAEEVVGVLLVIAAPGSRQFTLGDVQLLELIAPQAAVAISNSRLYEQERTLSVALARAKTQLEAVLASTDNPVLAVNHQLRVIFANQAAAALVADDAPPLAGQYLLDLIPSRYLPPQPRQLVKQLRSRKSYIYELEIAERTFLCHLGRMARPERGWVAVLNDVSSLKELDRLQRHMMEFTTHQLKNPLQGAMFHLDLHLDELRDLGEGVFTEEMQRDVQMLNQQLERMDRLIKGMLNLERLLNTHNLHPEPVDIAETVKTVVQDFQPQLAGRPLSLHTELEEELPVVYGDPQQLKEAIACLVDNAVKYTPTGSVSVQARQEQGMVLIQVQDSGIGIPPDRQGLVFERFFRVEQAGTEGIGGSGLGLSLVKTIIENHRGRVWLESSPGQGSSFFIALPGGS